MMLIAETLIDEKQHIENAQQRDKPIRSFAKAISWRITGSLDTMVISWFFTSNVSTAMAIGLTEVLTKTLLYYFHERIWNRVPVGIQR
jgi:uncharacterized membrane protein